MGWAPECQRRRWFNYTSDEWLAWIDGLHDGFGRYTKDEWMEWCVDMNALHGPLGGAPVPGVLCDVLRRLETSITATGGDATAIAAACPGCSAESITRDPPAGAAQFAIMFLGGAYFPQLGGEAADSRDCPALLAFESISPRVGDAASALAALPP